MVHGRATVFRLDTPSVAANCESKCIALSLKHPHLRSQCRKWAADNWNVAGLAHNPATGCAYHSFGSSVGKTDSHRSNGLHTKSNSRPKSSYACSAPELNCWSRVIVRLAVMRKPSVDFDSPIKCSREMSTYPSA